MKKRNIINIHILISISSIVLFSLALLACPEISSSTNNPSKKQPKQTAKTPDTSDLQSSPQYTLSDTLSKVLYNAAKNQNVPDDTIVDEDTSEAARTIFKALGVQAGDTLSVIHVDDNGNNKNDGSTWKKAKRTIKNALDTITKNAKDLPNPYLVLIGSGTYTPAKPLSMKNHVAIIGGFNASSNEASGYERTDKTTISGEHKRRVFFNTNLNTSAVLARVTINAGNATDGGGMYNSQRSSPTITHTTFSKNKASENGGGMYNSQRSSPTITHTTFSKNTASLSGGGMYNLNSSPTIMHTTFSGNTASLNSGGMCNFNSSPTIMHTTFSKNTASQNGGGMYNFNSSPTIMHTTFSKNKASENGGGMFNLYKSSPTITHTTFSGNTASQNGGGMYNNISSPTISSSIFWGNTKNNTPNQIENNNSTPMVAYSIVQGGDTSDTDIITTDPGLQPLANNGGFVQTIAIKAGSSAINKGLYGAHKGKTQYYSKDHTNWYTSPTLANDKKTTLPSDATKYTTDAQGYSYKDRPDIGAFEYEGTVPLPTP